MRDLQLGTKEPEFLLDEGVGKAEHHLAFLSPQKATWNWWPQQSRP